jgi:hypothetical protein
MPDDATRRSLRARIAAHESWARTEDRAARTEAARRAADSRFERLVDPHETLDPRERAIRAASVRKAHFLRLAIKSAEARSKKHSTPATTQAAATPTAADGAA